MKNPTIKKFASRGPVYATRGLKQRDLEDVRSYSRAVRLVELHFSFNSKIGSLFLTQDDESWFGEKSLSLMFQSS